ncbi:MAG: lactate racemase domain-containing protein [Desulfobacteraceae bacterium]|nr:lactate racemase domain-containing protein [Desulfobacteraceae bacterium]
MPFSFTMAYGGGQLSFASAVKPMMLEAREPISHIDPPQFRQRLDQFLTQTRLDLKRPALVVADKTRLCGYPQYLPVLIEALAARGADLARLKIFIAYGTHARQSEAESLAAYGPVYNQFQWIHHQCGDDAAFETLGRTRRGTPVRLRKDLLAASDLITFGAISHHYFAGYGGGRKLIFPGLGDKAAIYANHGLFLDRAGRRLAAGCQPGVIEGNPLAEDLVEIEAFRPADLAIHGLLDSHGQVRDFLVGQGAAHFQAACARHGACCEVPCAPHDLVMASCGGFPKDINFIQSHKAVHHAAAFVRDGGQLIVLAQCPDGIGSQTFLPWFEMGDWNAAFDRLAANYEGNGGTALAMMAKTRRIRISLVTDLTAGVANTIGVERLSPDQARERVAGHRGTLAVIPNASLVVPKVGRK